MGVICKYCRGKIKFLNGFWVANIPLDEKARLVRNLGGKDIYDTASAYCRYDWTSGASRPHQPDQTSIIDKVLMKYNNEV